MYPFKANQSKDGAIAQQQLIVCPQHFTDQPTEQTEGTSTKFYPGERSPYSFTATNPPATVVTGASTHGGATTG